MSREIEHVLEQCLTTRQLIEHLTDLDPGGDARVLFACNYGDYHNTRQALPVEDLDMFSSADLCESGYSQSGIAMVRERDVDDEPVVASDEESEDVIILGV